MSNENQSNRDQRQFWQMAIETWQSRGLSVRQFCKQEGLSSPSFYAWRKKLAKADAPQVDKKDVRPLEPFIQVSLPTETHSDLQLVFASGHRLKISAGIDRQTLSDVLSVLQQAGLC